MNESNESRLQTDARQRIACDVIIKRAAALMVEEVGASTEVMVDRLLTYAGAAAALVDGSPQTAKMFRMLADNIDAGCFHPITGEKLSYTKGKH